MMNMRLIYIKVRLIYVNMQHNLSRMNTGKSLVDIIYLACKGTEVYQPYYLFIGKGLKNNIVCKPLQVAQVKNKTW